jgi:hypothetical protein
VAPLEWELLQIYDEQHEMVQRAYQVKLGQTFELLQALFLKRR